MFDIIVNTEILRKQANKLVAIKEQLNNIEGELRSIVDSVSPSDYDGKFKKMVAGILSGAQNDTRKLSSEIQELQNALEDKADAFEKVNNTSQNAFEKIKISISSFNQSLITFWGVVAGIFTGNATSSVELGADENLEDHITVYPPVEEKPATPRTESVEVPSEVLGSDGKQADDCVEFVNGLWDKEGQTRPGFTDDADMEGRPYHPKFGDLTEYGDHTVSKTPQVGAIMTESKNSDAGIRYGHSSYVYSVTYDKDNQATSFKVAERNIVSDDPATTKETTFNWDAETKSYKSQDGKRLPNAFIYPK